MNVYHGGTSPVTENMDLYFDNVVIARKYIGPAFPAEMPSKGDVNGDGTIDTLDMQACINHILGEQDWGEAADVNGDGGVDALDLQLIINSISS